MASATITPSGEYATIHQGSNNPLIISLDMDAADLTAISVSLWNGDLRSSSGPLKAWTLDDVNIERNAIICPLTAEETAGFPENTLLLEVKGLDESGHTVFWERFKVKIIGRKDKDIPLE